MFPGPSVSRDRHSDNSQKKARGSRRRPFFYRLVLYVIIAAILVIWQLRIVIIELGNLQHELETWTTTRTILATFLSYVLTHTAHFVHHLWTNIFH
jgi:ABC-type sulfate transport system permease component